MFLSVMAFLNSAAVEFPLLVPGSLVQGGMVEWEGWG